MRVKEIRVKTISWAALSPAIQAELGDFNPPETTPTQGSLFWAEAPNTPEEFEEQPNWADLCRQEEFKVGEKILIEVPYKLHK